jgi:predicted DNA-binding transcriptional regulator YafY
MLNWSSKRFANQEKEEPNMRGDQIVRQWKIIQFLETRRYGISVAELAEELESQPRTIYRDLEALYNAGFPLYNDKDGKNSVWKLLETFRKHFRIWRPTQELREIEGGGIEISVEVPINYEIISWIMGFGSAAEVIEPESLRKQIMEEHVKAAKQYK